MSAPICQIHQTPMSVSQKGGGWYCAKKNPDGSWCKYKVPAQPQWAPPPPQAAPQAPAWVAPTPEAPAAQASILSDTGDAQLAAASLRFAASIVGSMPPVHENADQAASAAILIAVKAFRTMKAYLP